MGTWSMVDGCVVVVCVVSCDVLRSCLDPFALSFQFPSLGLWCQSRASRIHSIQSTCAHNLMERVRVYFGRWFD